MVFNSYLPQWQLEFTWTVYVGFVLSFLVAFGLGANDCANSYGTVVGAKVLKLWQAYILATIFELLGAGLLGYKVTETMRKSIVNVTVYDVFSANENGTYKSFPIEPSELQCNETLGNLGNLTDCRTYTGADFILGELGALTGTAFWLIAATLLMLPVSTTHSAVGATVGFSVVLKGSKGINWLTIGRIVISWVASPLVAGMVSVSFYLVIKYTVLNRKNQFDASLQMLPVFYFFTLSVNCFSVLYEGSKYLQFDLLPWWAVLLISLTIGSTTALITHFWGKRVIKERILAKVAVKSKKLPKKIDDTKSVGIGSLDVALAKAVDAEMLADLESAKSESASFSGVTSIKQDKSNSVSHRVAPKPSPFLKVPVESEPTKEASSRSALNWTKDQLISLKRPVDEDPHAAQVFNYLQIMSACFLSFSHGSNDTANAVGPLVGLWLTYKNGHALKDDNQDMFMQLIIMFGAVSMIVGLWVLGHKVIKTVGTEITLVTPPSGFAMEIGTAFTVLFCSKVGIPISTTHCAVGAIVSVGWMKSHKGGVSWKTFVSIAGAWVTTLPITSAIAAFVTWILITVL